MAWVLRRVLVVGLATAMLSIGLSIAPALASPESSLLSKINAERAANGKEPLQVYWDLRDDARIHAKNMRDAQQVYNQPNLNEVTDVWFTLAESVGVGASVAGIMDAFMASSSHRSSILNSGFNYIGAGVAEDDNGILWVDVIFMGGPDDLLDPPPTTTTTQPPATTTTTQPPATTTTTQPPGSTTTTTQPTTTTTQPPGSTTTTTLLRRRLSPRDLLRRRLSRPGSTTTTTLPPGDGEAPPGPDSSPGPDDTILIRVWALRYEQFAVLSPTWLNPALLRLLGLMGR